jgi:hypothetical protein
MLTIRTMDLLGVTTWFIPPEIWGLCVAGAGQQQSCNQLIWLIHSPNDPMHENVVVVV